MPDMIVRAINIYALVFTAYYNYGVSIMNGEVFQFSVYGFKNSTYAVEMTRSLILWGFSPAYILSIDDDIKNQAATRALLGLGLQQYPLKNDAWTIDTEIPSLFNLCSEYGIPCFAVPDLSHPVASAIMRANPVHTMLATDGPILRGDVLYIPRYGVLSVHAARLPFFRGNWATFWNLYHNQPLEVTAFIMHHWIDEGPILGRQTVDIARGDTLDVVNAKAFAACCSLAAKVLGQMADGSLAAQRQEPWQGFTTRSEIQRGNLRLPAMPEVQQRELSDRFAAGHYGFYHD